MRVHIFLDPDPKKNKILDPDPTRTRKKNKILDPGPTRTRSGPDPNILFNYTIKKNQEILKNKKESINIDFNSSMFRFKAECKSDLRLNLDIDPTRK